VKVSVKARCAAGTSLRDTTVTASVLPRTVRSTRPAPATDARQQAPGSVRSGPEGVPGALFRCRRSFHAPERARDTGNTVIGKPEARSVGVFQGLLDGS
jgi:hypothetical protein